MMRRGQSAVEYLFLLAAGLVMVLVATVMVFRGVKGIKKLANEYVSAVRTVILEGAR